MRLVKRGSVDDRIYALQAALHEGAIHDRADQIGELRLEQVNTDDLGAFAAQRAEKSLSEMPRATGDQDSHAQSFSREPVGNAVPTGTRSPLTPIPCRSSGSSCWCPLRTGGRTGR